MMIRNLEVLRETKITIISLIQIINLILISITDLTKTKQGICYLIRTKTTSKMIFDRIIKSEISLI